MHQYKVLIYAPQTELPQLTLEQERIDVKNLTLSKENFAFLKQRAIERMEAVINYADGNHKCRSQLLLAYFGETDTQRCNQCDVCLEENKRILHTDEFDNICRQIRELLAVSPMQLITLVNAVTEGDEDKRLRTVQWLLDNEQLKYNEGNQLVIG